MVKFREFDSCCWTCCLHCILWHRDSRFGKRGNVEILNPVYTGKMAAIIRVADALDRTLRQLVEDVVLSLSGQQLFFKAISKYSIDTEVKRAEEKSDLMNQAYTLTGVSFKHAKP
ncbi:MAG: hypothetical protein V1897_18965 [Pseudomonadota bacterium]